MKKGIKIAFTLVELIVVITILAILGTIGFISIQNYTIYSRDVVRITDINNIKSVLEYTYTESSRYPNPDNGEEITYDGGEVWTQGDFGRKSKRATKRLSKIPLDPLTQNKYTYSVLNTGSEYELGAVFEGEEVALKNNIINNTYADKSNLKAYISGNYNGQIAKVSTGGLDYILAVPSIINTDITETKLVDIISNKKLAMNGYKNIPSSYSIDSSSVAPETVDFVKSENLVVYSGSFETLKTDETERINLISNLQKAYSGTVIQNESQIKNIVSTEIDQSNPSPKAKNLVANIVNAKIITKQSEKITLVADNSNNNGGESSGPDMELKYEGLNNGDEIKLQFKGTVNITNIDWGDDGINGCPTTTTTYVKCKYIDASKSNYTIKVYGKSTGYGGGSGYNKNKLVSVTKWDGLDLVDLSSAFEGAYNLRSVPTTLPTGVNNISRMFSSAKNFNQDISNWDISNITSLNTMFWGAYKFNNGGQPLTWNTSNITTLNGTFAYAYDFNADISSWDTSNVTDFSYLFAGTKEFNSDISSWNTSNVTKLKKTFEDAKKFNINISSWDTSNVTNMVATFEGTKLFNQPLNNWNVSNVTTMGYMFKNTEVFNQDISSWNVSNTTYMNAMFNFAKKFNQNLGSWHVNNVSSCSYFNTNAYDWTKTKPHFNHCYPN